MSLLALHNGNNVPWNVLFVVNVKKTFCYVYAMRSNLNMSASMFGQMNYMFTSFHFVMST